MQLFASSLQRGWLWCVSKLVMGERVQVDTCTPPKQHRPRETYLLVLLRPLLPSHRAICHPSMSKFTTLSRLKLRDPVWASAGIYVASKIELLANVICPRRPPGSPHL
jgi:hypothetical protein